MACHSKLDRRTGNPELRFTLPILLRLGTRQPIQYRLTDCFMNGRALLIVATLAGTGLCQGEEILFNPAQLWPGTIVRIAALRPPITLSRAEVLACTSNKLTVSHGRDTFVVTGSNVLELAVLDTSQARIPAGREAETDDAPISGPRSARRPVDPASAKNDSKGFWDRVKDFWRKLTSD